MLPAACFAQDAPTRVPGRSPGVTDGEDLGSSLFVSEAVRGSDVNVTGTAREPIAPGDAGNAKRNGLWRVEPHLGAKGTYNDNLFIQRNGKVADYEFSLSPGLALGFWKSNEARERFLHYRRGVTVADRSEGSFAAFDYTAILLGFARTSSLNTVNHDARFDARWERGKFTVGGNIRYESKLEANADPGRLVTRKTLSASIISHYQLTKRTGLELGMYHETNRPEGFVRTAEWSGAGFADFAVTPRVRFGFGMTGGLLEVQPGFDQVFERVLARASYSLSEKLEAEFRGGVEFRQSVQPGDRTYPVFDFRTRWIPAAGTRVGFNAFRNVNKSIFEPEKDFTLTGIDLTFERAILGRLLLSIEGGYRRANYIGEARTDDYFFIRPGLSYALGTWGSIGAGYEYRENNSNREQSSFENNLVTLDMTVKY